MGEDDIQGAGAPLSDTDVDEMFDDGGTEVVSPFSPGSFFGDRYRIEESIGAGAMGAVFRATDLKADRQVALKILLKGSREEEQRERFKREYEILTSIDHAGIVGIHGFGVGAGGVPYLAMELLDGETLRERVQRKGPQDPDELVPILAAVCDTLDAAHAAGVVHRDLKPDHVFLLRTRQVKILDFGLSLAVNSKKLTATGTVIGTPRYMAPEQIASAHAADARSDVYALGVILYEALTGESPFVASDQGQLLGAIMTNRLEPLAGRRPDLPAEVDQVLRQAMAKDPDARFQSASDLAKAFAEAAGVRASLPPVRLSTPPPVSAAQQAQPNHNMVFLGLGLLGFAVAAAGAFLTYWLIR